MKLSVDVPSELNFRAVVFLDGVRQQYCTVADEEGGYIERFKLKDGQAYIETEGENVGCVAVETVYGEVRIIDPEDPEA